MQHFSWPEMQLEGRVLLASASVAEYPVPGTSPAPQGIASVPGGLVWITLPNTHQVASVNPTTGTVTPFTVTPKVGGTVPQPWGMTYDPNDGLIYFTVKSADPLGSGIGTIDPTTNNVQMPGNLETNANPTAIVVGPGNHIWFTESGIDSIAVEPVIGGQFEFSLGPGANPQGIASAGGLIWFTMEGTNQIGSLNPAAPDIGASLQRYTIPTANAGATSLALGPDGNLWFTESNAHAIGVFNPQTHTFVANLPVPTDAAHPNPQPQGIIQGPDSNMWFVNPNTNQFAIVSPAGVFARFNTRTTPSSPQQMVVGPNNNVFFTEGVGKVAQVLTFSMIAADDFDGDGKTDPGIFRVSQAQWVAQLSGGGQLNQPYGTPNLTTIPVSGDYSGQGNAQLAVYDPNANPPTWYIRLPFGGGTTLPVQYGGPGLNNFVPVPSDYTGGGQTENAVYNPNTNPATWSIRVPGGGTVALQFGGGLNNYIPVPGDYIGNGQAQLAVYNPHTNPATWSIRLPNGGTYTLQFGGQGNDYIPVPGDYLGIGQAQLAVFQISTATWFVRRPDGSTLVLPPFSTPGLAEVPVETTAGALAALGLIPTSPHVVVAHAASGGTANAAMPLLSSVQVGAPVVSGPLASSSSSGASQTSATLAAQTPTVGNRPVAQAIAAFRRRPVFLEN
jgi:streptogramin lyase